jgi:hypothetical protein
LSFFKETNGTRTWRFGAAAGSLHASRCLGSQLVEILFLHSCEVKDGLETVLGNSRTSRDVESDPRKSGTEGVLGVGSHVVGSSSKGKRKREAKEMVSKRLLKLA